MTAPISHQTARIIHPATPTFFTSNIIYFLGNVKTMILGFIEMDNLNRLPRRKYRQKQIHAISSEIDILLVIPLIPLQMDFGMVTFWKFWSSTKTFQIKKEQKFFITFHPSGE